MAISRNSTGPMEAINQRLNKIETQLATHSQLLMEIRQYTKDLASKSQLKQAACPYCSKTRAQQDDTSSYSACHDLDSLNIMKEENLKLQEFHLIGESNISAQSLQANKKKNSSKDTSTNKSKNTGETKDSPAITKCQTYHQNSNQNKADINKIAATMDPNINKVFSSCQHLKQDKKIIIEALDVSMSNTDAKIPLTTRNDKSKMLIPTTHKKSSDGKIKMRCSEFLKTLNVNNSHTDIDKGNNKKAQFIYYNSNKPATDLKLNSCSSYQTIGGRKCHEGGLSEISSTPHVIVMKTKPETAMGKYHSNEPRSTVKKLNTSIGLHGLPGKCLIIIGEFLDHSLPTFMFCSKKLMKLYAGHKIAALRSKTSQLEEERQYAVSKY